MPPGRLRTGGRRECGAKRTHKAAAIRAQLRVRAALLQLQAGDAEGAVTRLGEAHADLQSVVGGFSGAFECQVAFRELQQATDEALAPAIRLRGFQG